ncbi:MAG: TIGR01458 family HAD-type hydrolase [Bacteroidetes bacterium]|nr:TIGR01458 family HAD-type hydrolase [Bacteroidota bacterium]
MKSIKGVLFDLDGVFYVGNQLISGGNETLAWLRKQGIKYQFITNNTTLSRSALVAKLKRLGLNIKEDELLSANYAGVLQLKKMGLHRCRLILSKAAQTDYPPTVLEEPEAIVIGDIGNSWDYDLLNELMNQLLEGAELIALHKGRYFQTEAGLQLDSGAFVAALEHATGKKAQVVGKPSQAFFEMGSSLLAAKPHELLMVGDDLVNDIQGAQNAGYLAVLVQTGKYREALVKQGDINPNGIITSVAELPNYLLSS